MLVLLATNQARDCSSRAWGAASNTVWESNHPSGPDFVWRRNLTTALDAASACASDGHGRVVGGGPCVQRAEFVEATCSSLPFRHGGTSKGSVLSRASCRRFRASGGVPDLLGRRVLGSGDRTLLLELALERVRVRERVRERKRSERVVRCLLPGERVASRLLGE